MHELEDDNAVPSLVDVGGGKVEFGVGKYVEESLTTKVPITIVTGQQNL
jgi:hypothetical protein